ncbi:hypothetical protein C8J57DRAFT_1357132 [Mycena rebaudengoi]|nr:hypothetical protein C8J57DRAFT_1357132 [Mycena rebaudengoi]
MHAAKRASQAPPKAPRAHLDGLELGNNFTLPDLYAVRNDAIRSRDMKKHPEEFENIAIRFTNGEYGTNLPLPVIFNTLLTNLFRFSYVVHHQDVPEDILEDCIWALSLFIREMEECSEATLRAIGHVKAGNDYSRSKYLTLLNARGKIVVHLLRLGRPQDALPYAKAMVDDECSQRNESWLGNPMPFEIYGEALVLSRADDEEAVKILRRALLGIDACKLGIDQLLTTRVFLSRALRNVGKDVEALEHEAWLIKWFKKNPTLMVDAKLNRLLLPPGPILNGLGGEAWLINRKSTTKTDQRLVKKCRTCQAREPLVTLSKCNNCKHIYYCSKECQKAHWKLHKVECREMSAQREKIEQMSETDPEGAKRAADWSLWCNSRHDATQFSVADALGLHRDPKRARTHIVFKQVEYVPSATKLKHKFRVVSCGVFRIRDVLRDLETAMGLNAGEGQEYIDGLFEEMGANKPVNDPGMVRVPFVDLSFGDEVSTWLGSGGTTIDTLHIRAYDPHWRKRFNVGSPPGPMRLKSGAKDVEHIF